MRSYVLFSVVCLQLGWTYGEPAGVGVYAYQDSEGNRYGGTYGLDDAQFYNPGKLDDAQFYNPGKLDDALYYGNNEHKANGVNPKQGLGWGNYMQPPFVPDFPQFDDFFPQYFNNLENLLQEAFNSNFENQRLALNAAKKAYDLTSNHAGYNPHYPNRFDEFGRFGGNPFMSGPNSAFAGAVAGPGFTHQVAALNPENSRQQNVNVMNRFADTEANPGGPKFYSVSSSSYASSSNLNGEKDTRRGAQTVVNNNGQITKYKIES